MSDADKFNEAERRWASGEVLTGTQIHFDVCVNGRTEQIRLHSALILVERLKPIDDLPQILKACDAGIECARRLKDPQSEAYLMGKKAESLAILTGITLVPARKSLCMAPGWFGFSLERDDKHFKQLTKKIDANEAEVDRLLAEALAISERTESVSTKGHVLLCAGRVWANRYLNLKIDGLKAKFPPLPAAALRLLRPYRLDEFFLFTKADRARMENCLDRCEESYLSAVALFRNDGDESAAAYGFYNVANELRSAFRFRKAQRYLRLAKQIAERHGDRRLLPGIKALEKSIRARNRNTPDYVAGERRPEL